jgi:hypothetical protein
MRRRGTCGMTARAAGARERTAFGQWSRGDTRNGHLARRDVNEQSGQNRSTTAFETCWVRLPQNCSWLQILRLVPEFRQRAGRPQRMGGADRD